jgi:hypothetical protein
LWRLCIVVPTNQWEDNMKLSILAAVVFIALTAPAFADAGCSGCAVQQPDTPVMPQAPEDDSCNGCALPTPTPQRMADNGNCSGCAVEQPDAPVLVPTPEDGCSSCATPPLPSQRAAFRPIIVADGSNCSGC